MKLLTDCRFKKKRWELILRSLLLMREEVSLKVPLSVREGFNVSYFIGLLIIMISASSLAQSTRGLINDGVDLYKEQKFADAEVNFKKGTEKSPESFEAKFNLGDAYYKQERYEEAIQTFQSAFVNARSDEEKAKIFHNIGNSLLKSKKIKESISAYKEALKLNPKDQETKYNLSYALNMLNNPDQNQQQNDQNKDQNQDQNKEQQPQDQQKQDQQQQNKDQQQQEQQQQQSQEQKEQELTKQEAEKILEALKNNEKDLQKQLRKIKGQRVKTEKDW
ncbi:MAG: tetratricopeptide repeat protein [Ignavibacteriaceae bacterium]|nr:tetratricopeptide repeat protein [Ignavibacteriaceae bacterium]